MPFGLATRDRLRVAVLSPHLDDGVLSLGASIADATRAGHEVTVVTVFAGDTDSPAPSARWDRRSGFESAAEAARHRTEEDRRACRIVGASAVPLPFFDGEYAGARDDDEIWSSISAATEAADLVLLPGRPLVHPDHAWLAALLAERPLRPRARLYAELPYDLWSNPSARNGWEPAVTTLASRRLKWKASAQYASQLPWLRRGLRYRVALFRARIGFEKTAAPG
jgi:LmbE family N-acetylglucosaminyl deacetylase